MAEQNIRSLLFNLKPYNALLVLRAEGTSYASEISTKTDTTYSHAVKVMNRMKDHGLVISEKKGRKKEYQLTDNGNELVDELEDIEAHLDSTPSYKRSPKSRLEQADTFSD